MAALQQGNSHSRAKLGGKDYDAHGNQGEIFGLLALNPKRYLAFRSLHPKNVLGTYILLAAFEMVAHR